MPKVEYGDLYELIDDAILVYDPESRLVLDVNERACGTYDIPRETFVGTSVMDLWMDVEREERQLHTVVSEGSYRGFETVHRRDGGAPIGVCVNSSLIDFQGRRAVLSVNRDVTEDRRVEEALRESERSLAAAQRIAHLGSWQYDAEKDETRWSDEMYRIFGFAPQQFTPTLDHFLACIHPEDRDMVKKYAAKLPRDGRDSIEHRIVRPDGEIRFVHNQREVEWGAAGEPIWVTGTVQDITERRQAEMRLLEAKERYRTLVENMSAITYIQDYRDTRRPIYISPQVEQILGYTPEECVSTPDHWVKVLHPDDRERVLAEVERTNRTGEPFRMEYRQIAKDGRVVWLRDNAALVRGEKGSPKYWLGMQFDITQHKEAEEALKANEAKYRRLVEQIPVVTYIEEIDVGEPEWNMVYVSPQVQELLGYSAEEYTSKPKIWEELLHPDDRERVLAEDARTEETGEPFKVQYRILTRTGDIAWIRDEAVLVRDEEDRPLFWQGVMYDITDQKRAEEEVRRLNESLERRVAERTAQLEAYAEKLRRSNRELQDFAYIASHDLQEPLRKVLTFGDRLKAKYGEALGEQGRDYLERMEGAAARMRDLVDDLLTLSRITTQARPFVLVDLTEVAEEVVSDLEARIEEVGGRVEVGELPTIEADRLQMRQLLQNLIGNGLKFHKSGEAPAVVVRAEVVEERGRGGSEAPAGDGLCHIRVEDNGIGFDEEHLERIFMPFQRLHGRNVYEGTGMGLAICRKVVERHGGRITAESAPGRGATFTVTLPLVQPGRDSWTGRDEFGHHATPGR